MGKANRQLIVSKNIFIIKKKQFYKSVLLGYSGWGKTSEEIFKHVKQPRFLSPMPDALIHNGSAEINPYHTNVTII